MHNSLFPELLLMKLKLDKKTKHQNKNVMKVCMQSKHLLFKSDLVRDLVSGIRLVCKGKP